MIMPISSTVKDYLQCLMRMGKLGTFDKDLAKLLFNETSLPHLRKLLLVYSVRLHSSVTQAKAATMCYTRYYRGSESSRQEAVRTFESSPECAHYLGSNIIDLIPKQQDIPVIDLEGSVTGAPMKSFDSANRSLLNDPSFRETDEYTDAQSSVRLVDIEPLKILDTAFRRNELLKNESVLPDPLIEICKKKMAEAGGTMIIKIRVADIIREKSTSTSFPIPPDVPTILGLAEPAFFAIKSCISTFSFPANSPMEIIRQSVSFSVPDLAIDEKIILIFRSIGTLRDNRQADLPVGFAWSLNEPESSSTKKVRSSEKPKPKDWNNQLAIFAAPIILERCHQAEVNTLEFSFPKRPLTRTDFNCLYQGYIFVASPRSVDCLMESIPPISATESATSLLDVLCGGPDRTEYSRVTLPLTCVIGYGRLTNPCRSAMCDHPAVFGGDTYLQMNKFARAARWKCPRCDQIIHWYMLRRDRFMEYLVQEFPGCDKVHVQLDKEKENMIFTGVFESPDCDDEMEDNQGNPN